MRVRSEAVLGPLGMRPRHLVALTVIRDAGEPGQQDLAGYLRMDRTNLVGLLNELEGDGLIERRRSAADRRRHTVGLTEAGRRRLAEAEFALGAAEGEVLAALSVDQRNALHDLLSQALAAGDAACAAPGDGGPRAGGAGGGGGCAAPGDGAC
jgi:DNA-binding MarR family transcriptional regulator